MRIYTVFVSPGDVVAIPGGSATFSCFASPVISEVVTSAQWLLNGTLLEDSDVDFCLNYTTEFFSCFFGVQHDQN